MKKSEIQIAKGTVTAINAKMHYREQFARIMILPLQTFILMAEQSTNIKEKNVYQPINIICICVR